MVQRCISRACAVAAVALIWGAQVAPAHAQFLSDVPQPEFSEDWLEGYVPPVMTGARQPYGTSECPKKQYCTTGIEWGEFGEDTLVTADGGSRPYVVSSYNAENAKKFPNVQYYRMQLVYDMLQAHRFREALADLNKQAAIWYSSAEVYSVRADIFLLLGRKDLARADVDAAVYWAEQEDPTPYFGIYPERAWQYYRLGKFKLRAGATDEGTAMLLKARDLAKLGMSSANSSNSYDEVMPGSKIVYEAARDDYATIAMGWDQTELDAALAQVDTIPGECIADFARWRAGQEMLGSSANLTLAESRNALRCGTDKTAIAAVDAKFLEDVDKAQQLYAAGSTDFRARHDALFAIMQHANSPGYVSRVYDAIRPLMIAEASMPYSYESWDNFNSYRRQRPDGTFISFNFIELFQSITSLSGNYESGLQALAEMHRLDRSYRHEYAIEVLIAQAAEKNIAIGADWPSWLVRERAESARLAEEARIARAIEERRQEQERIARAEREAQEERAKIAAAEAAMGPWNSLLSECVANWAAATQDGTVRTETYSVLTYQSRCEDILSDARRAAPPYYYADYRFPWQ